METVINVRNYEKTLHDVNDLFAEFLRNDLQYIEEHTVEFLTLLKDIGSIYTEITEFSIIENMDNINEYIENIVYKAIFSKYSIDGHLYYSELEKAVNEKVPLRILKENIFNTIHENFNSTRIDRDDESEDYFDEALNTIKLYLKAGIDPNYTRENETLLEICLNRLGDVANNNYIKFLLKSGANPNFINKLGENALLFLTREYNFYRHGWPHGSFLHKLYKDTITLFLKLSDLNIKNNEDQTFIDLVFE